LALGDISAGYKTQLLQTLSVYTMVILSFGMEYKGIVMFKKFAEKVNKQTIEMHHGSLLEADVDKQELWDLYLGSFPEGTNPVYKERTQHDCNCCRHFIRDMGNMVAVNNGEVMTVWDIDIGGAYQVVADALAAKIRQCRIRDVYTHISAEAGVKTNKEMTDGYVKAWNHFYGAVPKNHINHQPSYLSDIRSTVGVFQRGLEEITDDSLNIVLDLISQNALYKGEEFKEWVIKFRALKAGYSNLPTDKKDLFVWSNYNNQSARIRNTAIGTLLQDISKDVALDACVASFEAKVAPENYRRPTPVITKKMITDAMNTIREDGIEKSLYRRFATIEDISVNDILFADRSVKAHMRDSLEASLLAEVKSTPKDFSKVTEISIEDFIHKVLPTAEAIEVSFENRHQGNLVSLVAPSHVDSPNLFKWSNPFSWSYNGNVTDSIKQRVKAAGGKVDGYLRASLSWFNFDDLDIHAIEPGGNIIYFSDKVNRVTGGKLDIDMNAGGGKSRSAVENITWPNKDRMQKGNYKIVVHNYAKRESIDVGFEVEVECQGSLHEFNHTKPVGNNRKVTVCNLAFDGTRITSIQKGVDIEEGQTSETVWDLNTNEFHKVSLMTMSPNHWGDEREGNKHYMFILEGCKNKDKPRGFYNEFLPAKYNKYRKVLEVLGDKTKCDFSDQQLSGLGFSSTIENQLICRVAGNVNRMLKIKF